MSKKDENVAASFPFVRDDKYIGNNWWFVPSPAQGTTGNDTTRFHNTSQFINYLTSISRTNLFNYIVIIIFTIVLFHRLQLSGSIWLGLLSGIIFVYYINEKNKQELNEKSDHLLNILTSDLLNQSKYFVLDPRLVEWINRVGELKKYNVLTFNKMVANIDRFLKLEYTIDINNVRCNFVLDEMVILKKRALNDYQSLIFVIDYQSLRHKYDHYMTELSKLLNEHVESTAKLCYLYDKDRITTISSRPTRLRLEDPTANDPLYNPHYDFFN